MNTLKAVSRGVKTPLFSAYIIEKDSRNSKNIGISYLYILKKSEDEYPDLIYFGGLYPKDGIHVAYPHELPDNNE